jgi:serine/threonine protein phosphatase 1
MPYSLWPVSRTRPAEGRAAVPQGTRVFAVGDIHGRTDLLDALHAAIEADVAQSRPAEGKIIYLGDYVDRGPDSAGVLDRLLRKSPAGLERLLLKGNHEDILERFLAEPEAMAGWCRLGGIQTMISYGVDVELEAARGGVRALARALRDRIPRDHLDMLGSLRTSASVGGYFFCHAGVRPGFALEQQLSRDLMWIRDEFLSSEADFGKVVVHGHTPVRDPEILSNRINIDTGAYRSGRLTCAVLEGTDIRLIAT